MLRCEYCSLTRRGAERGAGNTSSALDGAVDVQRVARFTHPPRQARSSTVTCSADARPRSSRCRRENRLRAASKFANQARDIAGVAMK